MRGAGKSGEAAWIASALIASGAPTFRITSVDVNHSFWPVQLGVKVDANRHAVTTARTTPNVLGVIDIKCAELCGLYHAYMESEGEIMTSANFNTWVTSLGGHVS